MRGNAVLLAIRQQGTEKGIVTVLLQLAEEVEDIKKTLTETGKAFEALVRVQTMLNGVADGLSTQMADLNKERDGPTR